MADSCYGYTLPDTTTPTMEKAWVDYGADAYAGGTFLVPRESDSFMSVFLDDLCQIITILDMPLMNYVMIMAEAGIAVMNGKFMAPLRKLYLTNFFLLTKD